jgi:pimeloyl-ACP methyl ester carboxylesterase
MQTSDSDFYLTGGGHRLRGRWYRRRTAASEPVIVMLHQGLGSVSQWRNFPEKLGRASGCAVMGYDRYGYGGSDGLSGPRAPDFLDREAIRALPEVLAALGIERPILYGHSDGGTIALMYAAAFPERPLAVISEAGHIVSEVHAGPGFSEIVSAYEATDLRSKLARHHGEKTGSMFYGWADIWRSEAMRDWQMLDRLSAIRCPLLIVQGENDAHGSAAQVEPIMERASGPVETFWIPDCEHSPHLEKPDLLVQRVAAFIAGVVKNPSRRPVNGAAE